MHFFSRLMGLCNELNNYIKISDCKCGPMEGMDKIAKMQEEEMVHQFLMGLDDDDDDDDYSIVHS